MRPCAPMRLTWRRAARIAKYRLGHSSRLYLWAFGGSFLLAWLVATGHLMYATAIAAATLFVALVMPTGRRASRRPAIRKPAKTTKRRAA